jgi:hypothetical protein
MNNKFKITAAVCVAALIAFTLFSAFQTKSRNQNRFKIMQLTSVESLVSGGMARSKLISSDASGKLEEQDLAHFYSLVGIKFDNINNNDIAVAKKLEDLYNDGWVLESTNSSFGVRASGSGNSENGIIVTRYILKKAVE